MPRKLDMAENNMHTFSVYFPKYVNLSLRDTGQYLPKSSSSPGSAVGYLVIENTTNEKPQWWKVRPGILFSWSDNEVERLLTVGAYNVLPLTTGSRVVTDKNPSGSKFSGLRHCFPRFISVRPWASSILNIFVLGAWKLCSSVGDWRKRGSVDVAWPWLQGQQAVEVVVITQLPLSEKKLYKLFCQLLLQAKEKRVALSKMMHFIGPWS